MGMVDMKNVVHPNKTTIAVLGQLGDPNCYGSSANYLYKTFVNDQHLKNQGHAMSYAITFNN